jgi:glycerol kinase
MVENSNFLQFLSNILKIKIIRPKNIETTALGSAYLAGLSSGIIKNTKDIEKLWKFNSKFNPKNTKKTRENLIYNWRNSINKLLK